MYKRDLASNSLQWLICHKTKPHIFNKYDKFGITITNNG